MKNEQNIQQRK